MPNYLIHVGPHKTATTYLQFRFDAVRRQLAEAGVAYPAVWSASPTDPSHRGLMVALRDGQQGQLSAEFAATERNNPDYILISGEGLNLLEPPAIALLKALVGDNAATIIFYCRRWCELLPSLWQEKVKHGSDATFPEFLQEEASDPFASPVMNFGKRLDIYAEIFGRQSVRLVSYSNLCDDAVDIAGHFFGCFLPRQRRLIDDACSTAIRPNASFLPEEVEVIRALNAIHHRNGSPADATLRDWYMTNKGRFNLAPLLSALQDNLTMLRLSDTSPDAQRLHTMLFEAYGDLMLPPVVPRHLFAPREAEVVFYKQHYLTDAGALKVLEDIYAKFRQATDPTPGKPL